MDSVQDSAVLPPNGILALLQNALKGTSEPLQALSIDQLVLFLICPENPFLSSVDWIINVAPSWQAYSLRVQLWRQIDNNNCQQSYYDAA
jgi:hypothetical protein